MIHGVGTDLVEVARLERAAERHGGRLLARVFTPSEIEYCQSQSRPFESFAARFAAKEAFLKAVGTDVRDGISWQDMEVRRDGRGPPELVLHGRALELTRSLGVAQVLVSLSHTADYATAMVVLEARDRDP